MKEILDFYSKNCVPCTQLKKELDNFENVKYIDVMEDFEKALQYKNDYLSLQSNFKRNN